MTKCIRDGKVAVIYSPAYSGGFSTWNKIYEDEILHNEDLVTMIESKDYDSIKTYLKTISPHFFISPPEHLKIKWIDEGTEFRIYEYHGYETVIINDKSYWKVA